MSYGDSEASTYDEPAEARMDVRARRGNGSAWKARAERIQKALEIADNALDTLHQRIDAVLRPMPSAATLGGVPSDPDAASELGAWMDNVERRLASLGMRTSELSERVDL